MNSYIEKVIGRVREKYPYQPEFCQTVEEVLSSLDPVVERHPEYEKVAEAACANGVPFGKVYEEALAAIYRNEGIS